MSFVNKVLRATRNRLYAVIVRALRHREMTSGLLRLVYKRWRSVEVGLYSYGCFDPARFRGSMTVGRYCSFAETCYRYDANHPLGFLSLHPYLYNVRLGVVAHEPISRTHCTIEDDVWVGHGAVILPGVRFIGRGAVIGAGAVVTRDVPRYSVSVGNPAIVARFRFDEETISLIESSKWWLLDRSQLEALMRQDLEFVFNPAKKRQPL